MTKETGEVGGLQRKRNLEDVENKEEVFFFYRFTEPKNKI